MADIDEVKTFASPENETVVPSVEPQDENNNQSLEKEAVNKEVESPEEKATNQKSQEKLSRLDKRIEQVKGKYESAESQEDKERLFNLLTKLQNTKRKLFSKEEIESGEIDPDRFEKNLEMKVEEKVAQAIIMDRIARDFENSVQEHNRDLEEIRKEQLDPAVEKLAVAQYEAVNFQYDPKTGRKVFVPAVKMSEIVSNIKTKLKEAAQRMVAEGQEFRKELSNTQAITPSSGSYSGSKPPADTTDFAAFEKAYSKK